MDPGDGRSRRLGSDVVPAVVREQDGAHEDRHDAYDAFGVFEAALQEKIGVFHSSSLKMAPKTPDAS